MSKFKGVLTDNAKVKAKRELRSHAMASVESPRVLEVFCGAGEMFKDAYHTADYYLGIDKRKFFDQRNTFVGDALSAVSAMDLSGFNIIDIDAYGSPYCVLDCISKKQFNSKTLAFVITDGVAIDLRMGRICKGIRSMLDIKTKVLRRAYSLHGKFITDICQVVADRMGGECSNFEIATGKTGAGMKYYRFNVET